VPTANSGYFLALTDLGRSGARPRIIATRTHDRLETAGIAPQHTAEYRAYPSHGACGLGGAEYLTNYEMVSAASHRMMEVLRDSAANRTLDQMADRPSRLVRAWLVQILVIFVCIGGCTTLPRLPAAPANSTQLAKISSISGARHWPDIDIAPMLRTGNESVQREMLALKKPVNQLPVAYYLAIPGGGDSEAFGAGLLVGWTASGTRPEFKVVTGIPTC